VLLFILVHKIGDTLANLTFRLLFNDLGYSNDEIAIYDVGSASGPTSPASSSAACSTREARPEALGAAERWC
jgi:hypothetical protein